MEERERIKGRRENRSKLGSKQESNKREKKGSNKKGRKEQRKEGKKENNYSEFKDQLYPTLYNLMDYRVHEILQARIMEWVAFFFSRGSFQHRDQTQVWFDPQSTLLMGYLLAEPHGQPNTDSNIVDYQLTAGVCPKQTLAKFC